MQSTIICGTLYLNISSFYPLYVERTFGLDTINSTMIAVAIAMFEFGGFVSNPIHAHTISKVGRKNSILIGLTILVLANTALGMLSYIPADNWVLFYVLSIVVRLVQGYGDSLVVTTQFSVIISVFSDEKLKYIGYSESAIGIGLMLGPGLGSFVFGFFGYAWAFYAFSVLLGLNLLIMMFYLPKQLNYDKQPSGGEETPSVEQAPEVEKRASLIESHNRASLFDISASRAQSQKSGYNLLTEDEITISKVMKSKEPMFALIASGIALYNVSFYEPFFSI
jgi:MFS family permease